MFTLLLVAFLIWFIIKAVSLSVKFAWGVGKIVFYIVIIPVSCVLMLMAGMVVLPLILLLITFFVIKWVVD